MAAAFEQGLPVLAICRGFQLLNVEHGGSLVQDVAPDSPHRNSVHEVALDPECVTRQSLRGPSGDDAILEVACGALEAKFLVGPRGRAPLQADVDAWTLDEAEHTLEALVDLDGDGVDELALRATAIERDAPYYLGWRDGGYAPLPGWDAHE